MKQSTVTITMSGNIQPASPQQIQQLPEEYQREEIIVIFTPSVLSSGDNFASYYTLADRIVWNMNRYRVIQVKPWRQHGFYQAYAAKLSEDV